MCTVVVFVLLLGPALAASGGSTAIAPNDANTTAAYDPPVVGSAKWPIAAGCFSFALYSGMLCLQPFHQTEQLRVHGNGSWTLERHLLGWNRKYAGSRLAKIRRVETGRDVNRNASFLLITDQNAVPRQRRFAKFLPVTEQDALTTYIHEFILKLENIEAGDSPVKAVHRSCPTE